jgi:photosystem II stability/assembly factor-like uncharacterized protein
MPRRMRRTIVLAPLAWALALRSLGGPAAAAAGPWTAIGPSGGTVAALAADPARPQTVYAVVGNVGLHKSVDGGASWATINQGLDPGQVWSVAIGPDGALYVGSDGLWRSRDGGATWQSLGPAGSGQTAVQFAFDASPGGAIYIATGEAWKSQDGGVTWTRMPIGPSGQRGFDVHTIAAHPRRPGVLLAGTSSGLFRSGDGGASWQLVEGACSGQALLFDPLRPQRVYAGCLAGGDTALGGVVESLDGGLTWQPAAFGLGTLSVLALAAPPAAPRTVYAGTTGGGVFRTTDAGAHWRRAAKGIDTAQVGALGVAPSSPAVLYAGTGTTDLPLYQWNGLGIFRSADAGDTWEPANHGIDGIATWEVVGDSTFPGLLLVVAPGLGVFRTRDAGGSWRQAGIGLVGGEVADLGLQQLAAVPGKLYALSAGNTLYASTDRGRSWTALPPLPASDVVLAADPRDPAHVLLGASGKTFTSRDGGATWQAAATAPDMFVRSFAFPPAAPQLVYGGGALPEPSLGFPDGQLFKSSDGGASWAAFGRRFQVFDVAVDPTDPNTIYAAVDDPHADIGLEVSRDAGMTWTQTGPVGRFSTLAPSPTVPGLVFAGLAFSAISPVPRDLVWRSTDSGATWSPFGGGIPTQLAVFRLVFDPAQPTTLLAATSGGIYNLEVAAALTSKAAGAEATCVTDSGSALGQGIGPRCPASVRPPAANPFVK